jgi:beta-glucanase (GH16 family)
MKKCFCILLFVLAATPALGATPTKAATPAPGPEWKLVWSDEFDKAGLPDPEKWSYEQGVIRNREAQYYTRERKENARVEGGNLILEARKEQYKIAGGAAGKGKGKGRDTAEITSASLMSKATWTYGRIEVRAKLPTGRGTWPAIWLLGSGGWPACGEIDIMENVGYDPDTIHTNIHTQKYNHVKRTNKGAKITIPKPYADFHVYAIEWHPDRIDSFVDGKKYFTFKNEKTGNDVWPFDKPERLKLNIAIGGDWGGQKGIDNSIFPQKMEIDYVRVYQNK